VRLRRLFLIALSSAGTALLAACGSGGGSSSPAPAPAPAPTAPPQISLGPGGRAATAGATVTFSVSATGSATRYQWRRNGVDIPGATASTYAFVVGLADNGDRFSAVVGNSIGQVTSDDALLTVYPVPPMDTPCQPPATVFTKVASDPAKIGVQVGATVGGCNGPLRSVQWTQTAGSTVTLLSDKTGAISFVPSAAEIYSFRADVVDKDGAATSATVNIPAANNSDATNILVRDDQAVRQGGNVSLRSWPALVPGDSVQSVTWQQTLGPPVVVDTSDPLRALFTAPTVTSDTVLGFTATLRTAQGGVATDEALVLVESQAQAPNATEYVFGGDHVSRVYAYKPAGQYASVLQRCVYDPQLQWTGAGKNTCSLAVLPFLAQTTGDNREPTVAEIMDRVVVSHDWMGAVFEQFIARSDMADVRRLLNGVTAVVIGAHVRPSFYFGLTGAIYLDADNFWLTPEQRDVIDETPDFRSDFDRDLSYSGVWRYTLNNNNIFLFFSPTSRTSRTLDYLVFESAWLLYHELGHAGDFLPPAVRGGLNSTLTAWDNIGPRYSAKQLPSDLLAQQLPLTSTIMRGLAQVKFFGATADATQRAYTPQQVAGFFSADGASDEYNYSTIREDIAMLFEEFMTYHRHGIRRDIAFTDKITPTTTGNTLIVRWGQRGRSGATAVEPRVKRAVQNIAPWVDPALVDMLPAPLDMRAGESWNANLNLPAPPGAMQVQSLSSPGARAADRWLLERALRRPGKTGSHVIPKVER
jgi:hypothetical protein